MSNNNVIVKRGIGVGGISFVALFALKVAGVIDLHWLLVLTSMIWVPVLFGVAVGAVIAAFGGMVFCLGWIAHKLGY